jgi:hypothetical protein
MAIKLLAHILRGSALAAPAGANQAPAGRSLDFARWVLEELIVARFEPLRWGSRQAAAPNAAPDRHEAAPGDSTWADTQPWCYGDSRLEAARLIGSASGVRR